MDSAPRTVAAIWARSCWMEMTRVPLMCWPSVYAPTWSNTDDTQPSPFRVVLQDHSIVATEADTIEALQLYIESLPHALRRRAVPLQLQDNSINLLEGLLLPLAWKAFQCLLGIPVPLNLNRPRGLHAERPREVPSRLARCSQRL